MKNKKNINFKHQSLKLASFLGVQEKVGQTRNPNCTLRPTIYHTTTGWGNYTYQEKNLPQCRSVRHKSNN
jgi:hypothetical protein